MKFPLLNESNYILARFIRINSSSRTNKTSSFSRVAHWQPRANLHKKRMSRHGQALRTSDPAVAGSRMKPDSLKRLEIHGNRAKWISVRETICVIHWIVIYPVDSAIQNS